MAVLTLKNDLAEIQTLTEHLESVFDDRRWPQAALLRITLSAEELLANIVRHGYPDGGMHPITVTVDPAPDRLVLQFEDDGVPFDPTAQAPKPDADDIDDIEIGGWGIGIVRRYADAFTYDGSDGRNRVTLVFEIKTGSVSG